ncbi:hypothetical protein [Algiphilus sp.]|uniref:hypothetical protein n=1 Tax=Algiphilus sp. TaxID=1872431 RepID=UPI002A63BCD9|nr:hypothetical protein [Pseudomonadota bacterium]
MTPGKKKRAREYMPNTVVDAQHHDSVEIPPPFSIKISRSYEARFMIASLSVRSIHCSVPPDMKRYRVLAFSFDTRAVTLATEIQDGWETHVKALWLTNQSRTREGLVHVFGAAKYEQKIKNFVDLGANPMSLLSFHNEFLSQCRNSFVHGSYYPALVSACTLAERMLNRLILHLRDYFKSTPQYKKVYRKESFDNWQYAVETLQSWGVLLREPAQEFLRLESLRNSSIHFNPETDENARELALEAIKSVQFIVEKQFSAFGLQPWYIPGAKGAAYVAKAYESEPFVKEVVLPSCRLVGPQHRLEHGAGGWIVHDDHEYEDREISDEEFLSLIR